MGHINEFCYVYALPCCGWTERGKCSAGYVCIHPGSDSSVTSNTQISRAILSDISTPENRSKALAHVGIAFAICFCIGPPIGAMFATRPLPPSVYDTFGIPLNVYAAPALLTLVLLVAETVFLAVALPETRGKSKIVSAPKKASEKKDGKTPTSGSTEKGTVTQRIALLRSLRVLHFFFLSVFSGAEFTLTFLTFDRACGHTVYFSLWLNIFQCLIGITNRTDI
jgi:hypothetical protein